MKYVVHLLFMSADFMASLLCCMHMRLHEQLLKKYKAQRHAVVLKDTLSFQDETSSRHADLFVPLCTFMGTDCMLMYCIMANWYSCSS